jgi:hypothetical protein
MSVNAYLLGLFERGSTTEYCIAGQALVVVRDSDIVVVVISALFS